MPKFHWTDLKQQTANKTCYIRHSNQIGNLLSHDTLGKHCRPLCSFKATQRVSKQHRLYRASLLNWTEQLSRTYRKIKFTDKTYVPHNSGIVSACLAIKLHFHKQKLIPCWPRKFQALKFAQNYAGFLIRPSVKHQWIKTKGSITMPTKSH